MAAKTDLLTLADEIDGIFSEKLRLLKGGDRKAFEEVLQEWNAALRATNRDLITTYSELERQASTRLNLLSRKLMHLKQKFDTPALQDDLWTLLEVVRRVREEKSWSAVDLEFQTLTYEDVYGPPPDYGNETEKKDNRIGHVDLEVTASNALLLEELKKKNREVEHLRNKLEAFIIADLVNTEKGDAVMFNETVTQSVFMKIQTVTRHKFQDSEP